MTQKDLNRAIARATGESVAEIAHRGFQPLTWQTDATSGDRATAMRQEQHEQYSARPAPRKRVVI